MRDLVAGERIGVAGTLTFAVEAPPGGGVALIALDPSRRASPAFPPIDSATRELRPAASFGDGGALTVRLDQVPADVERLMLVAFESRGNPIGATLSVASEALRFAVELGNRPDAAVILIELYRYQGGWRLAANGQGFSSGLIAVAATHGVDTGWARRLGHGDQGHDYGRETGPDGERRRPPGGSSSGSGVAVDRQHVLSNAHVVEDARQVQVLVAGRPTNADLVFVDPRNDLALLRVDGVLPGVGQFRAGLDLHLGEDIVVLGFPLQGLLGSGPQASAGNIAALCGVHNDSSVFQFTAPIASGNSGGPIVDMSGHVIGLVSSSLNLDNVRRSGGNAENINFGIKGAVIRSFLDAFGLEAQLAPPAAKMDRASVVRGMRDAIFRIACE